MINLENKKCEVCGEQLELPRFSYVKHLTLPKDIIALFCPKCKKLILIKKDN